MEETYRDEQYFLTPERLSELIDKREAPVRPAEADLLADMEFPECSLIVPEEPSTATSLGQDLADHLLVETGVPECSIIASDVAADAHNRCSGEQPTEDLTLLMAEEGFVQQETQLRWVTDGFSTPGGYQVRLGLTSSTTEKRMFGRLRQTADGDPSMMKLVMVTRDNIAFPIVTFNRAHASYCDYLQFWGEDEMSELDSTNFYGWGEDDNGSRYEAVQAVGQVIANGTNAEELADILKFDSIISKRLPESDLGTEEVIRDIFKIEFDKDEEITFERQFDNVNMGRADTDLTAQGTLQKDPSSDLRRRINIRQFPTTQSGGEWPEKTIIVDKTSGITIINNDGSESEVSNLQIQLLKTLMEDTARRQESKERAIQQAEDKDTFLISASAETPRLTFGMNTGFNFLIRLITTDASIQNLLIQAPLVGGAATGFFIGADKLAKSVRKNRVIKQFNR